MWRRFRDWLQLVAIWSCIVLLVVVGLVVGIMDLFNIRIVWSPW